MFIFCFREEVVKGLFYEHWIYFSYRGGSCIEHWRWIFGQWLASLLQVSRRVCDCICPTGLFDQADLTPYVTIRPLRRISERLAQMPAERLIAIVLGLFIGLVAAALLSLPLALLGSPFRQILPLVAAAVLCYLSVVILVSRQNDLQTFLAACECRRLPPMAIPAHKMATSSSLSC